jgi:hypothetical protein
MGLDGVGFLAVDKYLLRRTYLIPPHTFLSFLRNQIHEAYTTLLRIGSCNIVCRRKCLYKLSDIKFSLFSLFKSQPVELLYHIRTLTNYPHFGEGNTIKVFLTEYIPVSDVFSKPDHVFYETVSAFEQVRFVFLLQVWGYYYQCQ